MSEIALLKITQVAVNTDRVLTEGEHSFKTWSKDGEGSVHIKGGQSYFRYRGELYVFEAVRYFPGTYDHYMDAPADLKTADGGIHIGNQLADGQYTLRQMVRDLESGRLEPADKPEWIHDV